MILSPKKWSVSIYHLSLSKLFRIFVLCMQCFYAYHYKSKVCFENQYLPFYLQRNHQWLLYFLFSDEPLQAENNQHWLLTVRLVKKYHTNTFCTLTLKHIIYNTQSRHANYWTNSVLLIPGEVDVLFSHYFIEIALIPPKGEVLFSLSVFVSQFFRQ